MKNLDQWALKALKTVQFVVAFTTAVVAALPLAIVRGMYGGLLATWDLLAE